MRIQTSTNFDVQMKPQIQITGPNASLGLDAETNNGMVLFRCSFAHTSSLRNWPSSRQSSHEPNLLAPVMKLLVIDWAMSV